MQRPILSQMMYFQTIWLFLPGFFTLAPLNALAHNDVAIPQEIVVGVTDYPPLTMKTDDGRWIGLSFELWRLIAKDIGTRFEIREFE